MKLTTISIFKSDKPTWNRWKRKTGLKDAALLNRIINSAQSKIQYDEFVKRDLTPRDDFKRPLSDCKIDKKKVFIEKTCTT